MKKIVSLILVACMTISAAGCVEVTVADENKEVTEAESTEVTVETKEEIRLQDDFYGYINKEQIDSYKITYSTDSVGSFDDVNKSVEMEIAGMLKTISENGQNYDINSSEYVVKGIYEQTLEYLDNPVSSAATVFKNYYERIKNAKDIKEIENIISEIAVVQGIFLYFTPNVKENYYEENSYGLELSRMKTVGGIELKEISEEEAQRKKLHTYAMLLLDELGEDRESIKKKADDYIYFALDIASATDFDEMENGNPFITSTFYSNQEIGEMFNEVKIEELEAMYDLDNPYGGWLIEDEEQIRMLTSKFNNTNLEVIKTYMILELAMQYKDFLAADFEVMDQYNELKPVQNEKTALMFVAMNLNEQVGELYQKYCFSEKQREDYERMFNDIVASYDELISDAAWLTEDTRRALKIKLHNMVFVCGGGTDITVDNIRPGKDLFETYLNMKIWKVNRIREKIGKEIDRNESNMPSYVVNAAYSPSNTFTVTVAIGNSPFYSEDAKYEENLGGLGMVMAHEIGHAFDSTCMDWDANGKYNPEWICEEDRDKLAERLKEMEEYYSSYRIMEVYHVDGEKTSGENYADVGAMECLTNIVKDKEARKRMFTNYARIWCEKVSDENAVYNLKNDEHSPAIIRVNAVLSTLNEFYETYDIDETDGMYIAPESRVSRWR